MTKGELDQLKRHIDEAVGAAVAPLREELDELRAKAAAAAERDQRHSYRIREATSEARRSKVEATETAEQTVLAAVTHVDLQIERVRALAQSELAQFGERLDSVEAQIRTTLVPAAVDAKTSAENTNRLASWTRSPATQQLITAFVVAAITAIFRHCS